MIRVPTNPSRGVVLNADLGSLSLPIRTTAAGTRTPSRRSRGWRGSTPCATVDDGDQFFFSGGVPSVRSEILGHRTADAYGAPLRDGEPSIFMGVWDGGMFADSMTLQPGQAQQVARRLREVLTRI